MSRPGLRPRRRLRRVQHDAEGYQRGAPWRQGRTGGAGQPTFTLNTNTILSKTLVGSLGGTVEDIEDAFGLLLRKDIEPAFTEIAFDAIGDGLERLKNNAVTGRLVARFGE